MSRTERADCERPNVPAAAVAAAGVNHQGAEESRVCVWGGRSVSLPGQGGTGRNEEKARGEHPICDFCVGEEE